MAPRDVVAEAIDAWPSPLEDALFGTNDPDRIVVLLREYCRNRFGHELATLLSTGAGSAPSSACD